MWHKGFPNKDGQYFCVYQFSDGECLYQVCRFAHDLYDIDQWDFSDKKGVGGFYINDREYGYLETEVTAWQEIDEYRG